jgi:transcriptional regulator with XRE-family HTH domain
MLMPNTELLKEKMKQMHITQAQLAQKLGLAVPTVCQKINNNRPFSLDEAEIVATVLQIKDKDFSAYFFNK